MEQLAALLLSLLSLTQEDIAALEALYQKAGEKATPWIVAIKVEREPEETKAPAPSSRPPGTGRTPVDVFAKRPADAWCSGVILETEGTIATTHFNVSGKLKSILVRLADGRDLEGRLLGYNGMFDLAILKIEAEGLPVPERSRLKDLRTGNAVVALGRAPDGRGVTVNPGIVSSPSSLAGRGIQTDAKLNYGNVGGPLVDLEGRLVAVTCKVDTRYSGDWGQNSGVGFAIPHDRLREILPDLKAGKNIEGSRRPLLGVEQNPESTVDGAEILKVTGGGAAEKAGIKPKDVITEIDGKRIHSFSELRAEVMRRSPGDKVKLKVVHEGQEVELECELGWAPD